MLETRGQTVSQAVDRLAALLEERGYTLVPLETAGSVVAIKHGRGLGPFFPWSDYVFLVDLDGQGISDARSLEEFHQRVRDYGESKMRVPRPLRYRVPNSVTFGITARELPTEMIEYARRNRHRINSGEKNSVHLLDLAAGAYHSARLQRDPLRHGGSWTTDLNPTNRVTRMLAEVVADAFGRETGMGRRSARRAAQRRTVHRGR